MNDPWWSFLDFKTNYLSDHLLMVASEPYSVDKFVLYETVILNVELILVFFISECISMLNRKKYLNMTWIFYFQEREILEKAIPWIRWILYGLQKDSFLSVSLFCMHFLHRLFMAIKCWRFFFFMILDNLTDMGKSWTEIYIDLIVTAITTLGR